MSGSRVATDRLGGYESQRNNENTKLPKIWDCNKYIL